MADRSMIGAKYRIEWPIERGKILEFVTAAGDPNPIYRAPEAARGAGFYDIVAPPTFSTVPIMWSGVLFKAFDDLKIPLSSIMHAEQGYEFFRSVTAGDHLTGIMEIKSITEREGRSGSMEFVLFETIFTNQKFHEVLKEEMLVVERK